jgi:plasmid maintenance system antidote protein VapI
MSNRQFSERLNQELDEIGVPARSDERVEVFAKLLKVPRFKAEAILNGNTMLDAPLLEMLAEELEVSADWLLGKSEKRHN